MSLLSTIDVTKRFGGVVANDHITLDVKEGEILGIIGPNGSGKSTLFDVITGFHKADEGSVYFQGRKIDSLRPDQINRTGIARTFQKMRPFSSMSVRDNIVVPLVLHGSAVTQAKDRAMDYLEMVGLSEKANLVASGCSTGQRKRVELARVMATDPVILLLDEPMGGVDPEGSRAIVELIHSIRKRGVTIVVIEHRMQVLASLADRLIALQIGKIIAEGAPDSVLRHPDVVRAYLGDAHARSV